MFTFIWTDPSVFKFFIFLVVSSHQLLATHISQNKKAESILKCRLCYRIHICIVQFADGVHSLHEKETKHTNSIRQFLSFNGYCWARRTMVVSMVTPTCGKTETFVFVWFRDGSAGCTGSWEKRSSAHDYEEKRLWFCWLLPLAGLRNVQRG